MLPSGFSMRSRFLRFTGAACALGAGLWADASAAEHSWANPVPHGELRSLSTDRPDATESPFTVDAGHVQIEASVAAYSRVDAATTEWNVAPVNVRVGLRSDFEVQFIFDGYRRARTAASVAGSAETHSGYGDVTLRAKYNCWGNNGGSSAFGLLPFLKLPTNSGGVGNRSLEGGLILPVSFSFGVWSVSAMTEIEWARNSLDDGYAPAWTNSLSIGRELSRKLAAFAELASTAGEGGHVFGFNCGLTYAVHADLQLDCGANFGLSRAAPDVTVFCGVAVRY